MRCILAGRAEAAAGGHQQAWLAYRGARPMVGTGSQSSRCWRGRPSSGGAEEPRHEAILGQGVDRNRYSAGCREVPKRAGMIGRRNIIGGGYSDQLPTVGDQDVLPGHWLLGGGVLQGVDRCQIWQNFTSKLVLCVPRAWPERWDNSMREACTMELTRKWEEIIAGHGTSLAATGEIDQHTCRLPRYSRGKN